jgi:phosphate uptake regulator
MKRKLIKQGTGQGLVIYLPKDWLTKNNLKPKDEIEIQQIGNKLQISNNNLESETNSKVQKEINLNFEIENEKIIRIKVKNAFALGYNKFNITAKTQIIKDIINSTIQNHLLNCELTNETQTQLTYEVLGEIFTNKESIYLDKIFFFIQNSLENILQNQTLTNPNYKKRIISNSNKISLYENICKRNINLNFTPNPTIISYLLSYLIQLDHMIVKLSQNKNKFENDNIQTIQILTDTFKQIHKIYLKKKINKFEEISINLQNIQNKSEQEIEISKTPLTSHQLYQISRQMYLLINPIIHLEIETKN